MVDNASMSKKLAIASLGLGLFGVSQCFDDATSEPPRASLINVAPAETTPVVEEQGSRKQKIMDIIGDADSAYLNTSDPCLKEAQALNAASAEGWLAANDALEACTAQLSDELLALNARNQGILAEYKTYEAALWCP